MVSGDLQRRRILFLTYNFPPLGGAGVQRPTRFVQFLPQLGYEPIVVTGTGLGNGYWAPTDESFLDEVPRSTEVSRIAGPEPGPSGGLRARGERWLGLRSPWARWLVEGQITLGREAGADADLVYVWMQPYESAEAGATLAAELGKPWVADLGDPWALDDMSIYVTRLHRRRDRSRMRAVLRTADAIVMSTQEAARRLVQELPELRQQLVVSIPNGFDPVDFKGAPPDRVPGAFRIVHTGYLHTGLGRDYRRFARMRRVLGGAFVPGIDVMARSHVYLIQAVDRLAARDPALAATIEIHLAGMLTSADVEVAHGSSVVRIHGYISHREATALMRSADLLFLPLHDLPPGLRSAIVPGKTYEYLAAGPPILAAVPDGDARDLLIESEGAFVCRPKDVVGMAAAIHEIFRRSRMGEAAPKPRTDVVARYAYGRLAQRLAQVFDEVLGAPAGARSLEEAGARSHAFDAKRSASGRCQN